MRAALNQPLRFITDHRFTRTHASSYIDDALDETARKRVDEHVHVCPACMRFLNTLRRTVTALHTLRRPRAPVPPAARIADGVLARLRSDPPPPTGEPDLSPDGP
ncbi:MAG: anti-sigma factor family protein [Solirubrobacteraceae bacterium]